MANDSVDMSELSSIINNDDSGHQLARYLMSKESAQHFKCLFGNKERRISVRVDLLKPNEKQQESEAYVEKLTPIETQPENLNLCTNGDGSETLSTQIRNGINVEPTKNQHKIVPKSPDAIPRKIASDHLRRSIFKCLSRNDGKSLLQKENYDTEIGTPFSEFEPGIRNKSKCASTPITSATHPNVLNEIQTEYQILKNVDTTTEMRICGRQTDQNAISMDLTENEMTANIHTDLQNNKEKQPEVLQQEELQLPDENVTSSNRYIFSHSIANPCESHASYPPNRTRATTTVPTAEEQQEFLNDPLEGQLSIPIAKELSNSSLHLKRQRNGQPILSSPQKQTLIREKTLTAVSTRDLSSESSDHTAAKKASKTPKISIKRRSRSRFKRKISKKANKGECRESSSSSPPSRDQSPVQGQNSKIVSTHVVSHSPTTFPAQISEQTEVIQSLAKTSNPQLYQRRLRSRSKIKPLEHSIGDKALSAANRCPMEQKLTKEQRVNPTQKKSKKTEKVKITSTRADDLSPISSHESPPEIPTNNEDKQTSIVPEDALVHEEPSNSIQSHQPLTSLNPNTLLTQVFPRVKTPTKQRSKATQRVNSTQKKSKKTEKVKIISRRAQISPIADDLAPISSHESPPEIPTNNEDKQTSIVPEDALVHEEPSNSIQSHQPLTSLNPNTLLTQVFPRVKTPTKERSKATQRVNSTQKKSKKTEKVKIISTRAQISPIADDLAPISSHKSPPEIPTNNEDKQTSIVPEDALVHEEPSNSIQSHQPLTSLNPNTLLTQVFPRVKTPTKQRSKATQRVNSTQKKSKKTEKVKIISTRAQISPIADDLAPISSHESPPEIPTNNEDKQTSIVPEDALVHEEPSNSIQSHRPLTSLNPNTLLTQVFPRVKTPTKQRSKATQRVNSTQKKSKKTEKVKIISRRAQISPIADDLAPISSHESPPEIPTNNEDKQTSIVPEDALVHEEPSNSIQSHQPLTSLNPNTLLTQVFPRVKTPTKERSKATQRVNSTQKKSKKTEKVKIISTRAQISPIADDLAPISSHKSPPEIPTNNEDKQTSIVPEDALVHEEPSTSIQSRQPLSSLNPNTLLTQVFPRVKTPTKERSKAKQRVDLTPKTSKKAEKVKKTKKNTHPLTTLITTATEISSKTLEGPNTKQLERTRATRFQDAVDIAANCESICALRRSQRERKPTKIEPYAIEIYRRAYFPEEFKKKINENKQKEKENKHRKQNIPSNENNPKADKPKLPVVPEKPASILSWLQSSSSSSENSNGLRNDSNIHRFDGHFLSREHLEFENHNDIEFRFYENQSQNRTLGYLIFKPKAVKQMVQLKHSSMQFVCINGNFKFNIKDRNSGETKEYLCNSGDVFEVHVGDKYGIENLNETEDGQLMMIKLNRLDA